jgi:hypothetical protein
MHSPLDRRRFLRGALTVLATASCILPSAAPASARPGSQDIVNSPKGTFVGTYTSVMTEGKTGTLIVKVTQDKAVRGTSGIRKAGALLTLDSVIKNKKAVGGYAVNERVLSVGTPVRKGLALTVIGLLSEDGSTLEQGMYFLLNTSTGATVDQGTFVLTRQ